MIDIIKELQKLQIHYILDCNPSAKTLERLNQDAINREVKIKKIQDDFKEMVRFNNLTHSNDVIAMGGIGV